MNSLKFKILLFLLILSVVNLVWFTASLVELYPWKNIIQQADPDSILFARLYEQSILRGKLTNTDNYGCYPYVIEHNFPPFHLNFLFYFTNFVYTVFPDLPFSPTTVAGLLPILFVWMTGQLILLTLFYLDYSPKVLFFCGLSLLPGFSALMVGGFLKLDYDFLISFFIWAWLLSAMAFQDLGKDIWKIVGAVSVTLFIATWTGTPLFFFIVTLYCFLSWLLSRAVTERLLTYVYSTMLIGSILNLMFVANSPIYGGISLAKYGYFQPLCLLAGGFFIYFLSRVSAGSKEKKAVLLIFFVGISLLAIVFHEPVMRSAGIMLAKDPIHETISELKPILDVKKLVINDTSQRGLLVFYGWTIFLLPLFAFAPIRDLIGKKSGSLLRDWLLIMICMSIYQVRYIRWLSIGSGIYSGLVIAYLWTWVYSHLRQEHYRLAKMTLFLVPLLLLHNSNSFAKVTKSRGLSVDQVDAFNWISRNTPFTSGYDSDDRPEYSILPYWDEGNLIAYYSKRPVVVNNAQWGFKTMADIYSAENEDEAFALCNDYGVRYIYLATFRNVTPRMAGYWSYFRDKPKKPDYDMIYQKIERDPSYKNWFYFWLYEQLGMAKNAAFSVGSHFRIVYAAKAENDLIFPNYLIFEKVNGARLQLISDKGTRATISITVKIGHKEFLYKKNATADSNGKVIFVLPYTTSHFGGRISTDPFYKLSYSRDQQVIKAKVFVGEDKVLGGDILDNGVSLEEVD
ncbi:MAG: hypothetical protein KKB51_24325 [Candidatus Riflebacteria bacterium]|nr:hypothetical protein [Candidatus Riflebacteria bacterium]